MSLLPAKIEDSTSWAFLRSRSAAWLATILMSGRVNVELAQFLGRQIDRMPCRHNAFALQCRLPRGGHALKLALVDIHSHCLSQAEAGKTKLWLPLPVRGCCVMALPLPQPSSLY